MSKRRPKCSSPKLVIFWGGTNLDLRLGGLRRGSILRFGVGRLGALLFFLLFLLFGRLLGGRRDFSFALRRLPLPLRGKEEETGGVR